MSEVIYRCSMCDAKINTKIIGIHTKAHLSLGRSGVANCETF